MLKPGIYPLEAVQELESKLPHLKAEDIEDLESQGKWCRSLEVREKMSFLEEMIKGLMISYGDGTGIFSKLGTEYNYIETIKLINECITVLPPLCDLIRKLRSMLDEDKRKFDILMNYLDRNEEDEDYEIVDYDCDTIAMMREIKDITTDTMGELKRIYQR